METTTENPLKCYYSRVRDAQLTSKRSLWQELTKRLSQSSDIPVNCQYPGIVTLFKDVGLATQEVVGSGILLDESTILISEFAKISLDMTTETVLTVHTSSYDLTTVDSTATISAGTAEHVDGILYNVTLNNPVTFDSACTLPACVPNERITVADLDLGNCKVVASGTYDDSDYMNGLKYKTTVQEVLVEVDAASVTGSELTLTRLDAQNNIVCRNDGGGSVICPLTATGEWVTVALVDGNGFPCDTGATLKANVFPSLLPGTSAFAALQGQPYTNP